MESLRQAFRSPEGQAAGADVAAFAGDGVRSMTYELEEV